MESEIRAVDELRAVQMVMSLLTGDRQMFADALEATLADDWGFGQMGSTINVFRFLAADLAGALVDVHGQENAETLIRAMLVQAAART